MLAWGGNTSYLIARAVVCTIYYCMRSAVYIKPTMCHKANSFTLTEGGFVLYINGRLGPLITISYCGWYEDIFAVYRTTVTIKYCWITSINYRPGPINRGLRMRRECRERFSGDRGLAIPTCIRARASRVPWCIPGSLTSGCLWSRWRRNVPGISGGCAIRNFTYLVRDPWTNLMKRRYSRT